MTMEWDVMRERRGGARTVERARSRLSLPPPPIPPCALPTPPPPSIPPQVLLKKEGSEEDATNALGRVMLAAHGHLAKVANGEELFPRFHLADPIFAGEGPADGLKGAVDDVAAHLVGKVKGKSVPTTITKFAAGKAFFNFAPCVLSESPVRGGGGGGGWWWWWWWLGGGGGGERERGGESASERRRPGGGGGGGGRRPGGRALGGRPGATRGRHPRSPSPSSLAPPSSSAASTHRPSSPLLTPPLPPPPPSHPPDRLWRVPDRPQLCA